MKNKTLNLPVQFRTVQIREEDIDKEKRTINLTFSSEQPVERFWGKEILDHSPESVILDRLLNSAPLLDIHNQARQIGVVEAAFIGDDRRGHATVRFGRNQLAEEKFQDVLDGIVKNVSVGYRIHEAKLVETGDEGDTYRITRWEPLEISLVAIPADPTVGIGRSAEEKPVKIISERRDIKLEDESKKPETPNPTVNVEDAVKKERARIAEISAMGEQFKMQNEAREAIKNGDSIDSFRQKVLDKIASQPHIDTQQADLGLEKRDIRQYSILRGIQAMLTGDWSKAGLELECSREIEKRLNQPPKGFYVPHEILKRELTLSSGGTGLVGTDHLPQNFIELLRNRAKVAQLGARTLSGLVGNVSIPKQSGAATAYWVGDSEAVTESDSAYTTLDLSLKTIGAATLYSRALLLQSNPSVEALVMDDLSQVLALGIDLAAIAGTGTNNQPTGIINTNGVGSVVGTSLAWAGVVELETDVLAANADVGSMAYLTNASVNGLLKTRERASGTARFLVEDGIMNGYPVAVSNQVPSATMIFGVWNQVIIALWGGLDIWPDPYTSAADGGVYIRAFQSCDIGVRHPAAFSVASSIT